MIYIQDNETLKMFVPNVLKEAAGERTYFEKILPSLLQSEEWWITHVVGRSYAEKVLGDEDLAKFVRMGVAVYAQYLAVPQLDLILTPNGFGIISNQNLVPASKERVAALREQLFSIRNAMVNVVLTYLLKIAEWRIQTEAGMYISTTFNAPRHFKLDCSWEEYAAFVDTAYAIEYNLEESVLTKAVHATLVSTLESELTSTQLWLKEAVRRYVLAKVNQDMGVNLMNEAQNMVQRIRTNPDDFPGWADSDVAKLWSGSGFENEKESTGYFF